MNTMTEDPDDFEKRLAAIEKKLGLTQAGAMTIGSGGVLNVNGTITVGYNSTYVDNAVPQVTAYRRANELREWLKKLNSIGELKSGQVVRILPTNEVGRVAVTVWDGETLTYKVRPFADGGVTNPPVVLMWDLPVYRRDQLKPLMG